MKCFRAVAQVAAFFLIVGASIPSALAQSCDDCKRSSAGSPQLPNSWRNVGRVDVTAAVDTATSFIADAVRRLHLFAFSRPGQVDIAQQTLGVTDGIATYNNVIAADVETMTSMAADYVASYEVHEPRGEMPDFKHKYAWQLTYRDDTDVAPSRSQFERLPGMSIALDDSWVVGLRFEVDYGWTR